MLSEHAKRTLKKLAEVAEYLDSEPQFADAVLAKIARSREDFMVYYRGPEYLNLLLEIYNHLRTLHKYGEAQEVNVEQLYSDIIEMANDANIDPWTE